MNEPRIGVLGSTSLVAAALLPRLERAGVDVIACSRRTRPLPPALAPGEEPIPEWISTMPLWALPEQLPALERLGARHVVGVGSTSRFTKTASADAGERAVAAKLQRAEEEFAEGAARYGIRWTVLRPTLVYGLGRDRNVCEIARFVERFGFFPIFGGAAGLRQPVHAEDVAAACIAALARPAAHDRAFDVSGGETLRYRDMVERVFEALGRRPRLLRIPLWAFATGTAVLRRWPRYAGWTPAMAARMNEDLVFDHAAAARELDFRPRRFVLAATDLPRTD